MLAGAARGKKGSKDGGGQVRLLNVDTGRLSEQSSLHQALSAIVVCKDMSHVDVALFPSF